MQQVVGMNYNSIAGDGFSNMLLAAAAASAPTKRTRLKREEINEVYHDEVNNVIEPSEPCMFARSGHEYPLTEDAFRVDDSFLRQDQQVYISENDELIYNEDNPWLPQKIEIENSQQQAPASVGGPANTHDGDRDNVNWMNPPMYQPMNPPMNLIHHTEHPNAPFHVQISESSHLKAPPRRPRQPSIADAVLHRAKQSIAKICDPTNFHKTNPDKLVKTLLTAADCKAIHYGTPEMEDFFQFDKSAKNLNEKMNISQARKDAFQDKDVIKAIQEGDVVKLNVLLEAGKSMDGCNQFGESFLHIACRRGYAKTVEFLVKKARLSLRICDDHGRTPMHSACWSIKPQFKIVKLLMEVEPTLFLISDQRGHTPLMYLKSSVWGDWCTFIALCHKFRLLYPKRV